MKLYETVFILDTAPEASDAEIQKVVDLITANKGNVLLVDRWGMKKLTYEIKGKGQGYYSCVYFNGDEDLPAKLENYYQLNESCLRYLTVISAHTPDEISARAERAEARPAARVGRETRPAGKTVAVAAAPRAAKPQAAPVEAEATEEPLAKPEEAPKEADKAEEEVEKPEETPAEPETAEGKQEPQETKVSPDQMADEKPEEAEPEEQQAEKSEEEKSSSPTDK